MADPTPAPADVPQRFDVLGVGVSVVTPAAAVARLIEWSKDDIGRFVCIRDVHGVMHARHDPEFSQIHREAAMVTPDGMPLAWIGKLRKLPVARTCGPDLMLDVLKVSVAHGLKHYLYGAKDHVAQELGNRMTTRFPGLELAGVETPPFRTLSVEEVDELADRINASGADIVWIGLSTPKQEKLMHRLRPLVRGTLIGVGAAFDIHAGLMNRPPKWMQQYALEGVYRLVKEPRRLWKRYLVLAPLFASLATAQELGRMLGARVRES